MSLLLNSGKNTIGDRGCLHISGGAWLRVEEVSMGIHQNISGYCGVREEGCRAMAKWQGRLEINGIWVVTQVGTTKAEWPAPAS